MGKTRAQAVTPTLRHVLNVITLQERFAWVFVPVLSVLFFGVLRCFLFRSFARSLNQLGLSLPG
jgi:hypothetical protein